MNFLNPIFLLPATTGPIFMIAGLVLLKFPPGKINSIYGYRTSSSMKTQERWDFAQRFSAKEMLRLGSLLALTSVIGLVVDVSEGAGTAIGLGMMTLIIVTLMVRTERAIKLEFGS